VFGLKPNPPSQFCESSIYFNKNFGNFSLTGAWERGKLQIHLELNSDVSHCGFNN
jgi:hypothetical protein